jgi:fucose permease
MTPQAVFHRDRLTWLLYLAISYYGIFLNLLGPITPFLKAELNLSYTVSSLHFTAFAAGMLANGLWGHLVIGRLGRWRALWLGIFGLALGSGLLVLGRIPAVTLCAALLMGLVGSLILVIVPAGLSDLHGELRAVALSEANTLASLLTSFAPLLVGWFAAGLAGLPGAWRLGLALPALASLLIYLAFRQGARLQDPPRHPPAGEAGEKEAQRLPALFWMLWVALLLGVAVEFCMIFWSADYMEKILGLQKTLAAQSVSLFLAGMILGRLAVSRLVQRFSTYLILSLSILLAAGGFLLFWAAPALGPGAALVGALGLFLCGLGVAGLYPLILALAMASAGARLAQAGARAALASGMAILLLPLLMGRLADETGIQAAYAVVLALLLAVLLLVQLAGRMAAAGRPAGQELPGA